uniref:Uncharacterized protein n=1 Tax=Bicosoecida sp. CB-2014 TaxID=1486930 RepID=A0A7S1CHH6_9STRA
MSTACTQTSDAACGACTVCDSDEYEATACQDGTGDATVDRECGACNVACAVTGCTGPSALDCSVACPDATGVAHCAACTLTDVLADEWGCDACDGARVMTTQADACYLLIENCQEPASDTTCMSCDDRFDVDTDTGACVCAAAQGFASDDVGGCVCVEGKYEADGDAGPECATCPEGCTACDGESACTACDDAHFLEDASCKPCSAGCERCHAGHIDGIDHGRDPVEQCDECAAGFLRETNDSGFAWWCRPCPDECATCEAAEGDDGYDCSSCAEEGTWLDDGACVALTECGDDEEEVIPPTATSDRECDAAVADDDADEYDIVVEGSIVIFGVTQAQAEEAEEELATAFETSFCLSDDGETTTCSVAITGYNEVETRARRVGGGRALDTQLTVNFRISVADRAAGRRILARMEHARLQARFAAKVQAIFGGEDVNIGEISGQVTETPRDDGTVSAAARAAVSLVVGLGAATATAAVAVAVAVAAAAEL